MWYFVSIFVRLWVAGVFIVAGGTKLFISDDSQAGESATIIELWQAEYSLLIPTLSACEVVLGTWVLSGIKLTQSLFISLVVISAFTGVLTVELSKAQPRACGCFAMMSSHGSRTPRAQLQRGIAHNVCILIGLTASMVLRRPRTHSLTSSDQCRTFGRTKAVNSHAGFSLIEMLVVIGVIGILLGILLPILSAAKESARQTRCASNLHSLGRAFGVYAATWRGVLPRAGGYHASEGPLWMVATLPSLGMQPLGRYSELAKIDVLHCPSHPTTGTPASFVMNAMSFDVQPLWSRAAPACKWSRIRKSSRLPLLLETPDLFSGQGSWEYNAIFFEPALIFSNPNEFPGGARESISFTRHRNRRSNALFADGHVAEVRPGTLQFQDFDDGIVGR